MDEVGGKGEGEALAPSSVTGWRQSSENAGNPAEDDEGSERANTGANSRAGDAAPARGLPPDLAVVAAAWGELPEAVRLGIVAMIRATQKPA